MDNKHNWLANLKAGDEVALYCGHWNPPTIETVERVTKTQIILPRDRRFRVKTGVMVGSYRSYITQPTKDVVDEIERDKLNSRAIELADKITRNRIRAMSTKKLRLLVGDLEKAVTHLKEEAANELP